MSLTVSHGCVCLSLSLSSGYISLTVSHGCWLSLTVSLVPWSFYKSLIAAGCLSLSLPVQWSCCMFLTVSSSSIELLHVSHSLLLLPAVPHCVPWCCCMLHTVSSSSMEFPYVSLSLSPIVAGSLSIYLRSHRVSTCLSLSPMVAVCLSLSLPMPWR